MLTPKLQNRELLRMIEVIFALLARNEAYSQDRVGKTHAKIVEKLGPPRAWPPRGSEAPRARLDAAAQPVLRGARG